MTFTVNDLPEEYRHYSINMSNKKIFSIDAKKLQALIKSESNLVRLPDGNIINKAFIVDIEWNKELSAETFKKLPEEFKRTIADPIVDQKYKIQSGQDLTSTITCDRI